MLYLVLILSLVGMGAIGYLTYTKMKTAAEQDKPKILGLAGAALMLLSFVLRNLVG